MINSETKKSFLEILKDKVLLFLVAMGCVIILHVLLISLLGYKYARVEWTVSVSGNDLKLEDTVDVLKVDGTYKKTIQCLRKQDCIWFIGDYRQYVYTVKGPGIEFHPKIKYDKVGHYNGPREFNANFNIYQNGDRWDAMVTIGGYTVHYEDIENKEICIDFVDV